MTYLIHTRLLKKKEELLSGHPYSANGEVCLPCVADPATAVVFEPCQRTLVPLPDTRHARSSVKLWPATRLALGSVDERSDWSGKEKNASE